MASGEVKRHWNRVAELGCLISGQPNPTLHHCHGGSMRQFGQLRGVGLKTSDWLVIPLAAEYHTGRYGVDQIGVETWEKRFGTQVALLDKLCRLLETNVWERANIQRSPWA